MNTLTTGIHILLTLISFCGTCAGIRHCLRLSRFVAPMVAACAIVSILMFCGMAGMLDIGFWALYILGFAMGFWVWLVRRDYPDWRLMLALCVYCAYLIWRFGVCRLLHNDDLSHWGLVARFLLEERAFPDIQTGIVKFQSYPLGSAAWIFYITRTLHSTAEGCWFMAQYLWMGIAFLPMFAFIHKNKIPLGLMGVATFVYLLQRSPSLITLQVDWLMAFLGTGSIAAVLAHKKEPRTALIISIPMCMALVFVKSSGFFFALNTAIVMACALETKSRKRRAASAVLCCACFLGAFALWTLHVRAAYPAGLSSKHAISVERWTEELQSKGIDNIRTILRAMAISFVKPNPHTAAGWAYLILCAVLIWYSKYIIIDNGESRRAAARGLIWCAAAYIAWYVMLTLMYVFSMPIGEALILASYPRYTSTGLSYMMGLCCIQLLRVYGASDAVMVERFPKSLYALLALMLIPIIAIAPRLSMWSRLFQRETELLPIRAKLSAAEEVLQLPKGSRILIYCDMDEYPEWDLSEIRYITKYHFYTNDLSCVLDAEGVPEAAEYPERWLYFKEDDIIPVSDPVGTILAELDDYDACILLEPCDDDLNAALRDRLAQYDGDTKVVFAYALIDDALA